MTEPGERLQKLIAAAGITSRRKAEVLIAAGRVQVNGKVVRDAGTRADADDEVRVDGRPLPAAERIYLAIHKPVGVVSSVSDPHADKVVVDLLGPEIKARLFPAGRLDLDSEGLMILTNDGPLMNAMTRPGSGVEKIYEVKVARRPTREAIEWLSGGIELDGRQLMPCRIEPLENQPRGTRGSHFRVVLREGKKNQIRRMFREIGTPVQRLVRVSIGPVVLGKLRVGEYRPLRPKELRELRRSAGITRPRGWKS